MNLETASYLLFDSGIVLFALAAWKDHTRPTRAVWFDVIVIVLFAAACIAFLFVGQFSTAIVAFAVAAVLAATIVVRLRLRRRLAVPPDGPATPPPAGRPPA